MFLVIACLLVAIVLLGIGVVRPRLLVGGVGAILGFVVILVMPDLAAVMGTSEQMEHAETVAYCTSCHVMEKFGKSLTIHDPRYLPAAHYQNGRVPRETACYACHTDYAMFGNIHSKLRGLRHVWANYIGGVPAEIHLYEPYNNRECLHCHEGTRNFLETDEHVQAGMDKIRKNELSCVSSGCHSKIHAIDELDKLKLYTPPSEAPASLPAEPRP